ncbi:MAG: type II secretion system F family protein [Acidimicrobiia bacterium]
MTDRLLVWGLAIGWGWMAVCGMRLVAPRLSAARRARRLRAPRRRVPRLAAFDRIVRSRPVTVVARVFSAPRRVRRGRRAAHVLLVELPVAVDLTAVAIGAGYTAFGTVGVVARWGAPAVAAVFAGIDRRAALGAPFDVALREAGAAAPPVQPLTDVLRTSGRLGAPIAASLATLSQEVRADARRRAEARARTVPVRLLFPLVFCVLPAFALLTVVPVLVSGMSF